MKKMSEALYGNRGYTLIEIIIVVIMLSVISSPILYYFYNSQIETAANERLANAQGQANTAVRLILDDLRKVDASTTNLGLASVEVGIIGGGSTTDTIIIRFSDTNQEVFGVYNKILYKYTNNSIDMNTLKLNPSSLSAGTVIANDVQAFNPVQSTNPTQYAVSITLAPKNVGSYKVRTVSASNNFTPRFDMNIR